MRAYRVVVGDRKPWRVEVQYRDDRTFAPLFGEDVWLTWSEHRWRWRAEEVAHTQARRERLWHSFRTA